MKKIINMPKEKIKQFRILKNNWKKHKLHLI